MSYVESEATILSRQERETVDTSNVTDAERAAFARSQLDKALAEIDRQSRVMEQQERDLALFEKHGHEREQLLTLTTERLTRALDALAEARRIGDEREQCLEQTQECLERSMARCDVLTHELCVTRETLRLTAVQREYFEGKARTAVAQLDAAREVSETRLALANEAASRADALRRELDEHKRSASLLTSQLDGCLSERDAAREQLQEVTLLAEQAARGETPEMRAMAASVIVAKLTRGRGVGANGRAEDDVALKVATEEAA